MRKKRVIFVPGHAVSSPTEKSDWPKWLAKELENCGFEFIVLAMPNPTYPEIKIWLNYLVEQNFKIDQDTYFVGHSLGCITIARYLEKLPEKSVAGGCVFVAGFCSFPKIPILEDFCSLPLDFSKVKKHAREFVMIISDNDRVIPKPYSEELAEKVGARIETEHKMGHFVTGTKKIPSILNSILEMDQMREELIEMNKLIK